MVTFRDVSESWKKFYALGIPQGNQQSAMREMVWERYTIIRDAHLLNIGVLSTAQMTKQQVASVISYSRNTAHA